MIFHGHRYLIATLLEDADKTRDAANSEIDGSGSKAWAPLPASPPSVARHRHGTGSDAGWRGSLDRSNNPLSRHVRCRAAAFCDPQSGSSNSCSFHAPTPLSFAVRLALALERKVGRLAARFH